MSAMIRSCVGTMVACYVLSATATMAAAYVDVTGSGIASASSDQYGDVAAHAFDDDLGTRWRSYGDLDQPSFWLKYDLGAGNERAIARYSLTTTYFVNYQPIDWELQGSNDDQAWTPLHTVTDAPTATSTRTEYSYANDTAYRYYRVFVTETGDLPNYAVSFGEVELLVPAPPEGAAVPTLGEWGALCLVLALALVAASRVRLVRTVSA